MTSRCTTCRSSFARTRLPSGLPVVALVTVAILATMGCGDGGGAARDGGVDTVEEDGCDMASALDPDVTFPGAGESSVHDCVLDLACTEILVVAHRGLKAHAPENSLPAVRQAVQMGVDCVEMDVRATSDDVLVLMHDETVNRTTDGEGPVIDMTFDEIRALHLDTSDFPGFAGEDFVPSLTEAVDEVRGRALIYLDMKTDRDDLVVAAIQDSSATDFVMVYKGSVDVLERIAAADPDIHLFPSADDIDELDAILARISPVLVEMGGDMDPAFSAHAHAAGVKVSRDTMTRDISVMWYCDPGYWDDYLDAGIDVLQTNWPQYMLPWVK